MSGPPKYRKYPGDPPTLPRALWWIAGILILLLLANALLR